MTVEKYALDLSLHFVKTLLFSSGIVLNNEFRSDIELGLQELETLNLLGLLVKGGLGLPTDTQTQGNDPQ
jgi:hypothetical protein